MFSRRSQRMNRRGIGDQATSVGPSDGPSLIMSTSCVAAWRSDFGVSRSGTSATAWLDYVGGHLLGPGGVAPSFSAVDATINGRASITGNGTDQDLRNATLVRAAPGTTPAVIWAIAKPITWANGDPLVHDTNTAFSIRQSTSTPRMQIFNASSANETTASTLGVWQRFKAEFRNATTDLLRVGSTEVTGASAGNNTGTGIRLFVNGAGSAWGNYAIAELALFNAIPSADQNTALDAYVTARYGAGLV